MALNNLTVPTDDADEFQRILDAAYKKYQDSIENLTDAATDEIETAINRHDMALKEIVREYVADASQLAKDYHHLLRQAWANTPTRSSPSSLTMGWWISTACCGRRCTESRTPITPA